MIFRKLFYFCVKLYIFFLLFAILLILIFFLICLVNFLFFSPLHASCLICVKFFTAFLSRGDFNVIAVDWSQLAAKPWYGTAVENTHPVARHVAAFIDHMSSSTETKTKNVHLVGFSLGAHVAGLTANNVRSGRIRHITGK